MKVVEQTAGLWDGTACSGDEAKTVYQKIGQAFNVIQRKAGRSQRHLRVGYESDEMGIVFAKGFVPKTGPEDFDLWLVPLFIPFGKDNVHIQEEWFQLFWVVVVIHIHDHAYLMWG